METEFIGICLEALSKKLRYHLVHWLTFELGTSQTETNSSAVLVTEVATITRNCTQCCLAWVFLPFVHVVKF